MLGRRQIAGLVVAVGCLVAPRCSGQTAPDVEGGFCRITPGWTNYSTAFNATHDLGPDGDFATVASFYTPPVDTQPVEYGVIVIWLGSGNQRRDFANFDFGVFFWESLEAFRANPRQGDLATYAFPAPTGGSTTVPDTTTRGGRSACQLRFSLNAASLTLKQCRTYLVGFAARARVQQDGELFVPTAATEGLSDVMAGTLVPFGFTYLVNAGGLTIGCGQLATELLARATGPRPVLLVSPQPGAVQLLWPASCGCYTLETADDPRPTADWSPVMETPEPTNGFLTLSVPGTGRARFFRLVK